MEGPPWCGLLPEAGGGMGATLNFLDGGSFEPLSVFEFEFELRFFGLGGARFRFWVLLLLKALGPVSRPRILNCVG